MRKSADRIFFFLQNEIEKRLFYGPHKKGSVMMKRILAACCCLLLLCAMGLGEGARALGDEPYFVHITNGAKVNVRSGPSTGYKSIGQVKPGEDFPFLAWEDGWFQIELDDGTRGYVAEEMGRVEDLGGNALALDLVRGYPHNVFGGMPGVIYVHVTHHRGVNVRSGASTNNKAYTEAHPGEYFELLNQSGDWYKVRCRGRNGWLSASLVTVEDAYGNPVSEREIQQYLRQIN